MQFGFHEKLDSCLKTRYSNPMAIMNPSPKDVSFAASRLGRNVTPDQAHLLASYLDQLIKWNKKMNLVGRSTWQDVFNTLVVDSLYLADFLAGLKTGESPLTLDLGAGAGLPGIPLRCLWQDGSYWLVEVREKRSLFMGSVLGKMKLPHTKVFNGRAEDALEKIEADTADLILSRAFMPWRKLLEFTHPMLRQGGVIVILANDPAPEAGDLPDGWTLGEVTSYRAAKGTRYFWSLIRA